MNKFIILVLVLILVSCIHNKHKINYIPKDINDKKIDGVKIIITKPLNIKDSVDHIN